MLIRAPFAGPRGQFSGGIRRSDEQAQCTGQQRQRLLSLPGTRAELIKAMRARGIAIEDGIGN
jgi:hypothetical protein